MKKLLTTLFLIFSTACQAEQPSVFFANLKDGQTITSSFKLKMGVKGMEVKPAGTLKEGTGHHHLVIDESFVEKGSVVTKDATHIHFGKGQTEHELLLSPGKHTLTLQFADGAHQSYGKELSKTITVEVQK